MSDNGGRTWSVRGPAPQDVYCWSATRCVGGDYANNDLWTTTDGGWHWAHQAFGPSGDLFFDPVYCSSTGQCVATAVGHLGQDYVLTRSGQASAWAAHAFPAPNMLSLPLPQNQ
jgi:photosystem II stability/assembly factor-like uncharacterized protein